MLKQSLISLIWETIWRHGFRRSMTKGIETEIIICTGSVLLLLPMPVVAEQWIR